METQRDRSSKSMASKKRCHSDVDTISEPSGSLSACGGGALFFLIFNFLFLFSRAPERRGQA
jgi:hypothetical protein